MRSSLVHPLRHRRRSSRRPKRFSGSTFLAITQLSAEQLGEIAHEPARWQGEDPCPDNVFDHAPFDGAGDDHPLIYNEFRSA